MPHKSSRTTKDIMYWYQILTFKVLLYQRDTLIQHAFYTSHLQNNFWMNILKGRRWEGVACYILMGVYYKAHLLEYSQMNSI